MSLATLTAVPIQVGGFSKSIFTATSSPQVSTNAEVVLGGLEIDCAGFSRISFTFQETTDVRTDINVYAANTRLANGTYPDEVQVNQLAAQNGAAGYNTATQFRYYYAKVVSDAPDTPGSITGNFVGYI